MVKLVLSQAAQALNLSLSIGGTELYKTLHGRTFNLRVKSKYFGLNNRNNDHLPQFSVV